MKARAPRLGPKALVEGHALHAKLVEQRLDPIDGKRRGQRIRLPFAKCAVERSPVGLPQVEPRAIPPDLRVKGRLAMKESDGEIQFRGEEVDRRGEIGYKQLRFGRQDRGGHNAIRSINSAASIKVAFSSTLKRSAIRSASQSRRLIICCISVAVPAGVIAMT